jgi:3-methyl-2-oxobutanoate hydroxymethyltransferase
VQPGAPKKVLPVDLGSLKSAGQKIVVVTAYDAPGSRLADEAGVDVVLVGDSAAMTVLGHDSTLPVTIDEMVMLTAAVARGCRRPLIVSDLPFGSFQISNRIAVAHAVRLAKEAGADAVKLEGAGPTLPRVRAIVRAGIPVMGHVGLTPQSAVSLGGYKAQGRDAEGAVRVYRDALALERAGCFAIVLEAIPAAVAARITAALKVPTIGIGAGAACDGQVLVWHDLLGLTRGPVPRFVKAYARLEPTIGDALRTYAADVRGSRFPADSQTYGMSGSELQEFERRITSRRDVLESRPRKKE